MRLGIRALLFFIVSLSTTHALGGPIFDILRKSNGDVLGHIEFSGTGSLMNPGDVLDFEYTQAFHGVSFDEADVTQLSVLVDETNGTLCWGDWTIPGIPIADVVDGCGSAPIMSPIPRGLSATPDGINFAFFDNFGFETGTPNQATDGGDDDEDLLFRIREVPEPSTITLLGLGMLGIVFARRKYLRAHT